jgi:hypothetical protein
LPSARTLHTNRESARVAIETVQHEFDESQIWLTEPCAKRVDELMSELRFAVYVRYLDKPGSTDQALERQHDAWMHSWESVSKTKVPPARQALEAEMRSLLNPASPRREPAPGGQSQPQRRS